MNCILFMETPKRLGNRIEMFVMTVTMITYTWISSESTNEADWSTRWLLCIGTLLLLQVLLQMLQRLQVETRIWTAVQTLDAPLPVHIVTTAQYTRWWRHVKQKCVIPVDLRNWERIDRYVNVKRMEIAIVKTSGLTSWVHSLTGVLLMVLLAPNVVVYQRTRSISDTSQQQGCRCSRHPPALESICQYYVRQQCGIIQVPPVVNTPRLSYVL